MVDRLKKHGLKVTGPRQKILELLEQHEHEHLSVDRVHQLLHEAGEDVGLATVYRTLTQFEAAGIVIRHNIFEGDYAVFELNVGSHHDHLICVKCGKVAEFCDVSIERRQQDLAHEHNFEILGHELVLYGVCGKCAEARKNAK